MSCNLVFNLKPNIMKTKLFLSLLALSCATNITAQNSSYDANSVPILLGNRNVGFGLGTLINTSPSSDDNTAIGYRSLFTNSGKENTGSGSYSLYNNLSGRGNVANGFQALYSNFIGSANVAIGQGALYFNDGDRNVANGSGALFNNTTGHDNVGNGFEVLFQNVDGFYNAANGVQAMYSNISGYENVANGYQALYNNTGGSSNVASGSGALYSNTSGNGNTGIGAGAIRTNQLGNSNTALGAGALYSTLNSDQCTAIGASALSVYSPGTGNTAVGYYSFNNLSGGNNNTALGYAADVNSPLGFFNESTAIGAWSNVNNSNKIRLGAATCTAVEGPVMYTVSDGRFKTNVNEDDVKGLESIKLLRPVVYNFDTKKHTEFVIRNKPDSLRKKYLERDFFESTNIRQSGFIAQEVAQAAERTGYDFNGVHKPLDEENDYYTIGYSEFVVPLVKAVQEQQKMIEEQKKKNESLEQTLEEQKEMIATLQKKMETSTGINQNALGSEGFEMEQNEPNPFNSETTIRYTLPQQINNAYMSVYDLSGKHITSFPLNQKGSSSITITSDKLAAGIYIYSIVADGKIMDSKRMVVAEK